MTRRPIDARVDAGGAAGPGDAAAEAATEALREVFGRWATGVSVLAARDDDGRVYAMTIAALTPVSVDPPLILACIHNDAPLASVLVPGTPCAVSILTEGQKRAATTFADRFTMPGDLLTDHGDAPVVVDAAATLVGAVDVVHDGGDHRIVVLRIGRVSAPAGALPPLLYWDRGYRRMEREP